MTETVVFVEVPDGRTVHAGWIHYEPNAGQYKPSINFEYAGDFLADPGAYPLSPDLPLHSGFIPAPMSRDVFMAFADVQPDMWGRRLMHADFRRLAREEGRRWAPPSELDMLLHVPDQTRQGALRFRETAAGPFLGVSRASLPTLVDLDKLVAAADQFESGRYDADDDAIRMLIQVGTTQGGARPKATVVDSSGQLAIAKLPHPDDRWDVLAWEAVALEMAVTAGIRAPRFELRQLSERRSVLVTERFDRTGDGHRVGYLSAKALVLADYGTPVDYTILATHLGESSSRPAADTEELFRRVALTLLVNNVDDHMKNHGVTRDQSGWRLSPVFDVNPFPVDTPVDSTPVAPNDDPYDRDIRLLLDAADQFRLSPDRGAEIVQEITAAADDWAVVAKGYGVDADCVDFFATAFENPNRDRAATMTAPTPARTIDLSGTAPQQHTRRGGQEWVPPHIRNGKPVAGYWRQR